MHYAIASPRNNERNKTRAMTISMGMLAKKSKCYRVSLLDKEPQATNE